MFGATRLKEKPLEMRSEQEIFDELADLCVSPGYVHAFAALCFRDTVVGFKDEMRTKDMAKMFAASTLIRTELTTLMGLMIRQPIDFTQPGPETIFEYCGRSERLLSEMHESMLDGSRHVLEKGFADPNFNPFKNAGVLREAIFYGGESAYPFQYRDFAPIKYRADNDWLLANRGIDMEIGKTLVKALTGIINDRLTENHSVIRGKTLDEKAFLPGFTFSAAELAAAVDVPLEHVVAFLEAFTAPTEGCNVGFTSLKSFNQAYAYPLVRKGGDEYILFQYYGIAEAIYDVPFYWMAADNKYKTTAFANRGDFTEDFCFYRLLSVFGRGRVFKNVELLAGKGETLGEIDVLVIFGDQAVVVQAKSKKLTLEARNGNDLVLQGDFRAAVQDAVVQAFDYAALLGDPAVTLRCLDGTVIAMPEKPSKIYPITVLSDHYPGLAFQARQLLTFNATDQILAPLVTDIFTIDAMTEMLNSPLRLLSFLRLRAKSDGAFLVSHENTLLSYHLKRNLWQEGFDMMMIHDDVSIDLDIAMAARRDGLPGAKVPAGILTEFKGTPFDRLIVQIEHEAQPVAIALGFMLLELSGNTIKTFNRFANRVLGRFSKDGEAHNMTLGIGSASSGLTVHVNDLPTDLANDRLHDHCQRRKYSQKAAQWFGVALRPDGAINVAAVLSGPWKFNSELEIQLAAMPAPSTGFGTKAKRPGRNDLCPCGSGEKFKRCHGQ